MSDKREDFSDSKGDVASSMGDEMYYDPAFLIKKSCRSYRVPAICLSKTVGGPPETVFLLSRRELGDI